MKLILRQILRLLRRLDNTFYLRNFPTAWVPPYACDQAET